MGLEILLYFTGPNKQTNRSSSSLVPFRDKGTGGVQVSNQILAPKSTSIRGRAISDRAIFLNYDILCSFFSNRLISGIPNYRGNQHP